MKTITSEVSSKKQQYGDLIVTVHDKHGTLLQKVEQPVDSFNRQMWRILFANFIGSSATLVGAGFPLTNLNNTSYTASFYSLFAFKADGSSGSYSGILVGSGSNATTYNTVTMQTIIDHGDTNDRLFYQENYTDYNQSTYTSTLTRSFVNISANQATISVNEVGIALSVAGDNSAKGNNFLTVRDVLNATVSVPYEATVTVQYVVRISNGNRNYMNTVIRGYGITRGNTDTFWTNVNSGTSVITWGDPRMKITSADHFTNIGLVFGTSNAAFNVTQIDLVSRINNGTGAGQLVYKQTLNSTFVENSTTNSMSFKLLRSVDNNSGSNISIYEVGLFTNAGGAQSFMFDRKVIDPPVTVTNGNTVTIMWEFCYTV